MLKWNVRDTSGNRMEELLETYWRGEDDSSVGISMVLLEVPPNDVFTICF